MITTLESCLYYTATISNPEVEQTEGLGDADISSFCVELEDSLYRSGSILVRDVSAPLPHLGKRLPSFLQWLTSIRGVTKKEYNQIQEDDFATASHGEEIDLTFFPLAPGPYVIPYLFDGDSSPPYTKQQWDRPYLLEDNILCKEILRDPYVCRKALDRTITPAELRRMEYLLPLELMNGVNVLVSHGTKLNNRYSNFVARRFCTQEKLDRKSKYVKELHSEVTTLDEKLEKNELALERRLLLSDEFHAALAHVVSLGVAYGVERELRMGRTDAEFEAAVQNVSNFSIVDIVPRGALSEVTQILPDKLIRPVSHVSTVPPVVSEALDQALIYHASDDSPSVV
ncbi:hypothetical protein Tco_1080241 [Tanacetum coccineum]|uniref:Uncharacterized protein n=1 Tax=Tanacetum coccineum TaxID=301880 RepID=A0ABQ5HU51_9ASTR